MAESRTGNASFSEAWPELSERLRAVLRSRRVAPWLIDDAVQETGLRLFKKWDEIDPATGPWGLAITIARNLVWDEINRHQKRNVLGPVPEPQDSYDVERAGMARVELGRVRSLLPKLTPNYRSVLLAEVGVDAGFEGTPSSMKMLRLRARQRLTTLLERASALGIAVGVRMSGWRMAFLRKGGLVQEASAVTMVAIVTAISVIGPAASPVELDRSQRSPARNSKSANASTDPGSLRGGDAVHATSTSLSRKRSRDRGTRSIVSATVADSAPANEEGAVVLVGNKGGPAGKSSVTVTRNGKHPAGTDVRLCTDGLPVAGDLLSCNPKRR